MVEQQQQQQQPREAGTKSKYDAHFTDRVIAATGLKANPRLAQIMPSLVKHLHDFAREVDLTVEEWMAGVEMINEAGRMSDSKRNETGMLCDVLGLESLVDEITSKQQQLQSSSSSSSSTGSTATTMTATPSAILGPFYRADVPLQPLGSSILKLLPPAPAPTQSLSSSSSSSSSPLYTPEAADLNASCLPLLTHISGHVRSATTGAPIASGATLEVWQSAPNGLYEQQDDLQPDMNLRGRFITTTTTNNNNKNTSSSSSSAKVDEEEEDKVGYYSLICLKPTAYPIPNDGPAGKLLDLLDRHPFRPSHVHFVVSAPGFRTLTTQVFDGEDPYVAGDAVFAVKEELLVQFRPLKEEGDEGKDRDGDGDGDNEELERKYKPRWHLEFDFSLVEL